MLAEIEARIRDAQWLQDSEGKDHPGETQVFTFTAPLLVRWLLKAKRIAGLEFEKYNGEWYGIFRARK